MFLSKDNKVESWGSAGPPPTGGRCSGHVVEERHEPGAFCLWWDHTSACVHVRLSSPLWSVCVTLTSHFTLCACCIGDGGAGEWALGQLHFPRSLTVGETPPLHTLSTVCTAFLSRRQIFFFSSLFTKIEHFFSKRFKIHARYWATNHVRQPSHYVKTFTDAAHRWIILVSSLWFIV